MPRGGFQSHIKELINEKEPVIWVNWNICPASYMETPAMFERTRNTIHRMFQESGYEQIRYRMRQESVYVLVSSKPYRLFESGIKMLSLPVRNENGCFVSIGSVSDGTLSLLAWDIDTKADYINEEELLSLSFPDKILSYAV